MATHTVRDVMEMQRTSARRRHGEGVVTSDNSQRGPDSVCRSLAPSSLGLFFQFIIIIQATVMDCLTRVYSLIKAEIK